MNVLETLMGSPLLIVRLIAAIGGFVVGYMFTGPFWRLFWRVAFRKPVPAALIPWLKFCTGLVLAALLYSLVGFGGGGGFGWGGGGTGSGTGTGAGKGTGKGNDPATNDPKKKGDGPAAKTPGREILYVELLGGERYKDDNKFYLLGRKTPPVLLAEIEDAFKTRPDKIELHIVYTPSSVGQRSGPADRLRDLASKYQVPLLETVEEK